MAAVKLIVLLGLFAISLGFTIPEINVDDLGHHYDLELQSVNGDELIRNVRSPQGRVGGGVEHNMRDGTSAVLTYSQQIGRNLEAYGEAARNFRHNDNSAMLGVRYQF